MGERREKVGMRKVFLADRTWVKTREEERIFYIRYLTNSLFKNLVYEVEIWV